MARFSDIRRGQRLNQALTNYVQYLTTPRTPNLNSRGARPAQMNAFLTPYGLDIGTDELVVVRAPQTGYNTLAGIINATAQAEVANDAGAKTPTDINGFTPARVTWFRNTTRSVTVETSDITQSRYLKYAGSRFTCPFGRKNAADDLFDAADIIKTAIKGQPGFQISRVSITVERIKQN